MFWNLHIEDGHVEFLIEVQDVNDTIPKLASLFKIGYKVDLSEYTVLVPTDLGKGRIAGVNLILPTSEKAVL